jgi:hypothetical protein
MHGRKRPYTEECDDLHDPLLRSYISVSYTECVNVDLGNAVDTRLAIFLKHARTLFKLNSDGKDGSLRCSMNTFWLSFNKMTKPIHGPTPVVANESVEQP